jgi:flavoprotein
MNLIEIATGWYDYAKGTQATRQLMDKRLKECETCENKVQMNSLGQILVQLVNEKGSIYKCSLCGCPLSALTAGPASKCKAGKWKQLGD